jgi:hypothetical protein
MTERASCPRCQKRRPERFCPAAGEKICAVCCGTERERTLDCPADCAHLIKAHRYEQEHRQPPSAADVPFPDTEIARNTIHENESLITGLAQALLKFSSEQPSLTDSDVLEGVTALGETYRTLISGIYYEKRPDALLPALLYAALAAFLEEYKKQTSAAGRAVPKDAAIFAVLVYVARVCRSSTNERPRSRLFLHLLRAGTAQPQQEAAAEASRIILP